ncbi:MAG: 16S rRNA (cytosine(1402)-N(4))-methyltransferase RsmH [Muribaculaceae bacterium]|nr:16S rRNA (cytosine(1402)-N(4))-methyltransferase RsmH [Muribaculaceae bacterium]
MNQEVYHIPALLPQTIAALDIKPGGVYVDATYGGGGHSAAILEALGADGRLYGFDQDEDAVRRAPAAADPRFTMVYSNFRFLHNFMDYYGVPAVDGVLADLGVSFHHFDDPSRGFSFRWEGALDMRMNRRGGRSAADLLATASVEDLTRMLRLYGELRQAPRLAQAIVKARATAPVDTVEALRAVAEPLLNPRQVKKEMAQLFQALRIEVNDELGALRALLRQALKVLRPGGRLAIITYHSLEDRLVKNFMRTGDIDGREQKDFFGRSLAPMRLLNAKPIVPDDAEIEANPRSRSAKLRVAEKLSEQ